MCYVSVHMCAWLSVCEGVHFVCVCEPGYTPWASLVKMKAAHFFAEIVFIRTDKKVAPSMAMDSLSTKRYLQGKLKPNVT